MSTSNRVHGDGRPVTAEQQQTLYRKRRLLLRAGQVLMAFGGVVLVQHWLVHLEAFGPGQPPGWVDLVSGYPMGGILLIGGAVLAGRKPK